MRGKGIVLLVLFGTSLIFGGKLSAPNVTSDSDALTFLLRDRAHLLYVSDVESGPTIGGLTQTPFVRVPKAVFEASCDTTLLTQHAILVDGDSLCLDRHRDTASTYVHDGYFQAGTSGFTLFLTPQG